VNNDKGITKERSVANEELQQWSMICFCSVGCAGDNNRFPAGLLFCPYFTITHYYSIVLRYTLGIPIPIAIAIRPIHPSTFHISIPKASQSHPNPNRIEMEMIS
jgi:hypothetical protein